MQQEPIAEAQEGCLSMPNIMDRQYESAVNSPPLNIVFRLFSYKADAFKHICDVVNPSLLDAKLISSFVQVHDLLTKMYCNNIYPGSN